MNTERRINRPARALLGGLATLGLLAALATPAAAGGKLGVATGEGVALAGAKLGVGGGDGRSTAAGAKIGAGMDGGMTLAGSEFGIDPGVEVSPASARVEMGGGDN